MVKQIEYENLLSDADRKKINALYEEQLPQAFCILDDYKQIMVHECDLKKNSFKLDAKGLKNEQSVEIQFIIEGSKYIIRGNIEERTSTSMRLSSNASMYMIQRRDNFRVSILGPTLVRMVISTHNNSICDWRVSVLNISLGGCLVEVLNINQKVHAGDEFEGVLQADGFREINIKAIVRRVQSATVFGLEFKDLKGRSLGFVNEIVMKVSREASRIQ